MSHHTDKHIISLTAAAALAIGALYAISVPVGALSSFPPSNASAQRFASFLIEHRTGLIAAVLHAITAVSFARSGAFSPSGIALAAPPAFALLMVCLAGALIRGLPVRAALPDPSRAGALS